MSAQTKIVRRFYEACTRGDVPGMLDTLHAEIRFDPVLGLLYDRSVYQGHDGMTEWYGELMARWDSVEQEVEDARQVRDDLVIAFVRIIAHRGEQAFDARIAVNVRFRDGKIVGFVGRDAEEAAEDLA